MDLTTTYCGLQLPHPFIAGAGPLADTVDGARRVEDAGAAAIVMRSLFEEQLEIEALATQQSTETHAHSYGEALSYFVEPDAFVLGPHEYLEQLRRVRAAVAVPVFASLNGYTQRGWLDYAAVLEQAGASGIELNFYHVETDPAVAAGPIEDRYVEMVRAVREAVQIPLAVKLSPFYTSAVNFAARLEAAGADGLVLFNRFYEADIDVEELELVPHLRLSDSHELLLRLRWLAILSGTLRRATLAVTGGVHAALDAIKATMCGAAAIQVVSAVLRHGAGQLTRLRNEVAQWLEEHQYASLAQMRGSMDLQRCPDPSVLSRANYVRALQTWKAS